MVRIPPKLIPCLCCYSNNKMLESDDVTLNVSIHMFNVNGVMYKKYMINDEMHNMIYA